MQKSYRRSVFLGVLILIFGLPLLWLWAPADFSNPNCKLTKNAAWISVDWTSKPVDETSVKQLAESAKSRNLKYLFPFVSYLKSDGSFSPSYQYAKDFVTTFKKLDKNNTRVLAWIGLPIANNGSIGIPGWVNLSDQNTRKQIVLFISDLLTDSNFDGVHIDAEIVRNNDSYFLDLLEEIRQNIRKDKIISIAGAHWQPDYTNNSPSNNSDWTSTYYQEVGQRVGQIASMTYDSAMPYPALYRVWTSEQVKGIHKSLENADTELLIGISISQEDTYSHRPVAENLANGLAGLCAGLSDQTGVQGVAIYADWEFSQSDWQTWETWQK
jgi:hypothetical protein